MKYTISARFCQTQDELMEEEYEDLYGNLITKRNHLMADRVGEYIERGNAFIAVGAGHLGGEEGLLKLLKDQGFTITRCKYTQ